MARVAQKYPIECITLGKNGVVDSKGLNKVRYGEGFVQGPLREN